MSQKQWKTVRGVNGYLPGCGPDPEAKDGKGKTVVIDQSAWNDWKDLSEQALGNIRLRLHFNIGFTGGDGAFTQWVHCEFIVSSEPIRPPQYPPGTMVSTFEKYPPIRPSNTHRAPW
jgi:hypothetical protein